MFPYQAFCVLLIWVFWRPILILYLTAVKCFLETPSSADTMKQPWNWINLHTLALKGLTFTDHQIFWIGRDPQEYSSPASKWMTHTKTEPTSLVLTAPCSDQLSQSQGRMSYQPCNHISSYPNIQKVRILSVILLKIHRTVSTKRNNFNLADPQVGVFLLTIPLNTFSGIPNQFHIVVMPE